MTPLERLLAEEIPTGTFGGARTRTPAFAPPARPVLADPNAAEHVRALEAELDRLEGRGTGKPYLRVVDAAA